MLLGTSIIMARRWALNTIKLYFLGGLAGFTPYSSKLWVTNFGKLW